MRSTRSLRHCKNSSSRAIRSRFAAKSRACHDSFKDLGIGLLFAAMFVYLLTVVNYQNFGEPFGVILR